MIRAVTLLVACCSFLPVAAAPPGQHLFEVPLPFGLAAGDWEAGSSLGYRDGAYPPFFGEDPSTRRDEWRVAALDASVGAGGASRFRLQAGWQRFEESGGLTASGIEDVRLSFTWKLPVPRSIDFGLSLAAKLPNASHEKRLGTDQTDLLLRGVAGSARDRWGWAASAGLGLLGHPSRPATQDDVLWLGAAAWLDAGAGRVPVRWLAEVTGITTSRFFNDARVARAGVHLGRERSWGLHLLARRGLTSVSERWGAQVGLTWPL